MCIRDSSQVVLQRHDALGADGAANVGVRAARGIAEATAAPPRAEAEVAPAAIRPTQLNRRPALVGA
eukprot:5217400-Alexandrium_andersonii.AAC.1